MEMTILSIGVTIIKMGVFGGLGAGIIAGVKWFGKYDPKLNKGKDRDGGGVPDAIENLRKATRH